ncbi:hypothetical protein LCGC14_2965480, partial [marine sediment metagenome]
ETHGTIIFLDTNQSCVNKEMRITDIVFGSQTGYSKVDEANAKRICQCVNACAGMDEPGRVIDGLVAACQVARKWFEDFIECKPRPTAQEMQNKLHEAIVQALKQVKEMK